MKSRSALFGIRCEDKYYQLEEMEDKETCTTEVFLKADRTIGFGESDGPLWATAVGVWNVEPGTDNYSMSITRVYASGQPNTDMGEFDFEVSRIFAGEMTMVGESVGITGVTYAKQAMGEENQEVGYYNMIDGTDERNKINALKD
eukprot:CAMPEP_0119014272 /NCGR_PEP_ID=MMETSP1176-20130426/9448_1 /TAXON_ID=265551 /ORGANISM="Synedropsis recta cf, Strain CCMP1620" /LENGTH=144 /DNA_ID=CAMNT_0006967427 /DNA_START=178 /DNA_END=612 /DNA_ORIENTATION=-